jgi:hypothetical protein
MTMKTIVSALVALSVLAGIAAPASAFDAKKFWSDYDLTHSN